MAAIARTAASIRARLAAEDRRPGGPEPGLSGECVRASFAVRDALRAAGYDARVRAGYFEVDMPDPETCLCGSFEGHPRSCRFVPHAWVETGGCVVDVTADQFNILCFGGRFGPVEVLPIDGALRQRWRARLPAGVHASSLNGGWRAGEVREFKPA
jgi:hypothetical protein